MDHPYGIKTHVHGYKMNHPYGIHIAYGSFSNPRIQIRGYKMNHPYGIKTHVHGLKSAVTR